MGLGLEARKHLRAARACLLEARELGALALFQLRELGILSLELTVELLDAVNVCLDQADLAGAGPAKVTVVDKHAAGAGRVFLVEQQLQRLFAPNQIGRAQLPGQSITIARELGLKLALVRGKRSAARCAYGALAAQIALHLLLADLLGDPLDFGRDGFQLGFGLARLGFGTRALSGARRPGEACRQRQGACQAGPGARPPPGAG